ncbi:hypothetical protein IB234_19370 [Pseudomonas sp. PDM16]|uniref:hypothetical protein n=1 Tax=Pseudomonas sp. PDM16 TaxID=2769292 RepID=UPI001783C33F|nr:hypothetical protein [Pseudomonas sp. PDM16]MBD9416729.1 hypothetical protein [Pseudomonas sp. PDM16]
MNSLCRGVWGSFTTPRSRALGGKSGMTRAAPLVFFPLSLADLSRLLLLLAILALWRGCTYGLPPGPPPLLFFALDHSCSDCPRDDFRDLITSDPRRWWPRDPAGVVRPSDNTYYSVSVRTNLE